MCPESEEENRAACPLPPVSWAGWDMYQWDDQAVLCGFLETHFIFLSLVSFSFTIHLPRLLHEPYHTQPHVNAVYTF